MNPFSDPSYPLFGPGKLGTPPEYSTNVTPANSQSSSLNDPRLKPKTLSPQKSSSDLQLSSLLSAGDLVPASTTQPTVDKDTNKPGTPLSTSKPPSKLLQSTNAETKPSPTKPTNPIQQNSSSLDESQTININKSEKTPSNSDTNTPVKTQAVGLVGQSLNISTSSTTPAIGSPDAQIGRVSEKNKATGSQPPQIDTSKESGNVVNIPNVSIPLPQVAQPHTAQQPPMHQPSVGGDSEMQDDNDDVAQSAGLGFQGISLGGLRGKLPAASFNPFGDATQVAPGTISNAPFSGVSPSPFQQPNVNIQQQQQAQTSINLFGQLRPNFGGTSSLFQGPSLLQGIGGSTQQPSMFAPKSGSLSFGSIANQAVQQPGSFTQPPQPSSFTQPPQPGGFGQPANPMAFGQSQSLFGGNSGQNGLFGASSQRVPQGFGGGGGGISMQPKASEMKGDAFTSYRT